VKESKEGGPGPDSVGLETHSSSIMCMLIWDARFLLSTISSHAGSFQAWKEGHGPERVALCGSPSQARPAAASPSVSGAVN
jgi:hypothetical protein